jgi:type IV secretion system protein VirB4
MIKLGKVKTGKQKYAEKEISVSNFLPYHCHWNKETLLTHKKQLIKIIRLSGFSFETADDEDVDAKKSIRNLLFKGLSSGNFSLYFHTIRRKKDILSTDDMPMDPHIKLQAGFTTYVEHEWKRKYASHKGYINELYISIIRKEDTKGAAIFQYLLNKFEQSADKSAWEEYMHEAETELNEVVDRILNTLRDYNPKVLSTYETSVGYFSEILSFLGGMVNCGADAPMRVPNIDINKYLVNNRLYFGAKSIEARGPSGSKYAGILSVKEYGPTTYAGIFDSFLQLPFEFVMTQSFSFVNRQIAINKMQLKQNRLIQAEDKGVSQIAEITAALDMATSGDIAFGEHHLTVMCVADNLKALENNLSIAHVELANGGINPIREHVNMEACFWGQFPGNIDYVVRKSTINTLNLAGYASFHNYPIGKEKNNHWGDAVTVLDTTSGTPYYFNFHVRDVGHTLIIGPTGAGKTVLMNFLCVQAQRFKGRMFFFDKDRGAEIFIRALEGRYTVIEPKYPCYFNPLQLDDTGENRTFLLEWLKLLVTINNESLSSEDIALLNLAIEGNFKLDKKDRVLRNVAPFLGIEGPGTLAGRLALWHSRGSYAAIFDNNEDLLDLNAERIFGFEMAELLRDPTSLSPVLLYLFHKISISLDGTKTMIVLDEAWALIDNPVFGPKIKDWLKVLRKLNTMVVFATQSVEDASKSAISDTLVQQTATQIFLPNLKATSVYREVFMLSKREYTLIKTTDPGSRYFLIKQGISAVVARIDLSGLENIVNVLSGRSETVLLLDEIRKEVGDDPDKWLPIFYERVKKVGK